MAQLMLRGHFSHFGGKVVGNRYSGWMSKPVLLEAANRSAHTSRRHCLNTSARCCRCKGVKLRWREGNIFSAHHSSTDNDPVSNLVSIHRLH